MEASSNQDSEIRYDNAICLLFAVATLLWGTLAAVAGIFTLSLRLDPQLFPGVYELGYGRMQPLAPNLAIFGFAANAVFTAIYYSTQRLCKTRMWSSVLGQFHFWCWQAIVFAMLWTLGHGVVQPRELAEAEWPIDLSLGIVWIVFFALNLFMTIANRRESRIYISLWFYLASAVTVGLIYIGGNVASPGDGWTSSALLAGVPDAMVQAWYRHNLSGFLLVLPMVGAMYYFLPKITQRPIYSYRLAIIHFWGFALLYGWTSMRPLHYAPIPDITGSLAVVFGLILWMPQWGGVLNGWHSLKGAWKRVLADPSLSFLFTGVCCFALLTLEETLVGLRGIAALTQYSDWASAHRQLLVFGFNGMMALGIVYWMVPRIVQSNLWSPFAAKAHFLLSFVALLLIAAPLYLAGFVQGQMWLGLDNSGQLTHPEFVDSLVRVKPMWQTSLIGLGLFAVGILIQLVNIALTWTLANEKNPESETAKGESAPASKPFHSDLEGAPVLALAVGIDRMSTFEWHQKWEQHPVRLCLVVLACFAGSSLLLLGPSLLFAGATPATSNFQPLTPLEQAGREIYIQEGCYNCHSQTVRPLVAETKRYGDYSVADEFSFDQPALWGSRRIGPDLARQGGLRPSYWHWQHLNNPRFENADSVMPSFSHLLHERLDFDSIADHAEIEVAEEAEVSEDDVAAAKESTKLAAKSQAEQIAADIVGLGGPVMRGDLMTYDTQVIALIAYLQRLGTDLTAPAKAANGGRER